MNWIVDCFIVTRKGLSYRWLIAASLPRLVKETSIYYSQTFTILYKSHLIFGKWVSTGIKSLPEAHSS